MDAGESLLPNYKSLYADVKSEQKNPFSNDFKPFIPSNPIPMDTLNDREEPEPVYKSCKINTNIDAILSGNIYFS
jgi:hypothetical protein